MPILLLKSLVIEYVLNCVVKNDRIMTPSMLAVSEQQVPMYDVFFVDYSFQKMYLCYACVLQHGRSPF